MSSRYFAFVNINLLVMCTHYSYDTDECLQVFTESMTPTDEPGHFGLVTERLGGLNSKYKFTVCFAINDPI